MLVYALNAGVFGESRAIHLVKVMATLEWVL